MKLVAGFALAFAIGALCRLAGIPVPAPPAIVGALLVLSMTTGYLAIDRFVPRLPKSHEANCAGPSGRPAGARDDD